MVAWTELRCKACGAPATISEEAFLYTCPHCKVSYERVRQADGADELVEVKSAMSRLLSESEFHTAAELKRTLPAFIADRQEELLAAQHGSAGEENGSIRNGKVSALHRRVRRVRNPPHE